MKPGNNTRRIIDRIVEGLLVVLMILMLTQVIWQVISRYALSRPSSITDELSRFLLIWIGILGASYVMGQKSHLAITYLYNYLSQKMLKRAEVLVNLIIVLFSIAVLIIGGIRLVYITLKLGQTSASLQIPLGLIYMIIPVSGILTVYYCIHAILNRVKSAPEDAKF